MTNIHLLRGDITKLYVDAIVNAANNSLTDGSGVNGAIHRAGGPKIKEECDAIRTKQGICNTGDAVITSSGNLPAKLVMHVVGPVWHGGHHNEEKLLENAYHTCLLLADKHHIKSIAFPNISTGIFGFPKENAAMIAINTVRKFIEQPTSLKHIYFVCFDEENHKIYQTLLEHISGSKIQQYKSATQV